MNNKNELNNINHESIDKAILDILLSTELLKKAPNSNVTKISNNLYVVDDGILNNGNKGDSDFKGNGNIVYFADEKGDVIFNLSGSRISLSTLKGSENAGFVEKLEGKEYVLYKKVLDKKLNKIDKYSMEYFKAWEDILFYSAYDENLKYVKNNKLPGDRESIDKFDYMITLFKAVKPIYLFKYLESGDLDRFTIESFFLQHYIDKKILLDQCGDERFDRIGDPITYEEIDFYLGKKMISEEYANQCKARIDDRMKMIQELNQVEDQKQNEIETTKQEYAIELREFREKILKKY
ncbi:MAG: hypothetical protein V3575_04040 [Candidatus Absconditabacteria bacterium]